MPVGLYISSGLVLLCSNATRPAWPVNDSYVYSGRKLPAAWLLPVFHGCHSVWMTGQSLATYPWNDVSQSPSLHQECSFSSWQPSPDFVTNGVTCLDMAQQVGEKELTALSKAQKIRFCPIWPSTHHPRQTEGQEKCIKDHYLTEGRAVPLTSSVVNTIFSTEEK